MPTCSAVKLLIVPESFVALELGFIASYIVLTHSEVSIPSKNLSWVSATSGIESILQQITLASKWQEKILKGLLGCEEKAVSAREGSITEARICLVLISQRAIY